MAEKKEVINEEFKIRIKNSESGEDLFTEEDLSYCEIEIGTALESESDQLYYIITAGDEPDENNEVVEFEIYAPVDKCIVIKQRNYNKDE